MTASSEQEHSDIPFSSSRVTGQRAVRHLSPAVSDVPPRNKSKTPAPREAGGDFVSVWAGWLGCALAGLL